jgi:hypothetical protein
MVRQVVVAVIALALVGGCGKQLNAAYCDSHPNDPDCRNSGLVEIDAPMGECNASAMCAGNPNGEVCDVLSQTCVQCIVGQHTTACTGATPQCGPDHVCHGCLLDAHCATGSNVCLPNGECAAEAAVLYARPMGTGTSCTQQAACTFTTAVTLVDANKYIIKLMSDGTSVYREPPITIATTAAPAIQILGHSARFEPTANGNAITVTAGNVEIVGLTVAKAAGGGSGVVCNTTGLAVLSLRQMKILDNTAYGVTSQGCTVTIERTRISRNPSAAMQLTAGKLEIRNNIIDHNGNGTLESGNVNIRTASGRVVFNTIVENLSKGGSDRTGGVDCTPASGQTFLVARNIITDNGSGNPFRGNCTTTTVNDVDMNYVGTDVTAIKFENLVDYKLTAMSPATILRDDPESGPDCMIGSKYIDDYAAETRPVNYCDRGADEFHP